MIRCKPFFLQIIASELEYGLHGVGVATGELASAKAVSEGTKKMYMCKKKFTFVEK